MDLPWRLWNCRNHYRNNGHWHGHEAQEEPPAKDNVGVPDAIVDPVQVSKETKASRALALRNDGNVPIYQNDSPKLAMKIREEEEPRFCA